MSVTYGGMGADEEDDDEEDELDKHWNKHARKFKKVGNADKSWAIFC